MDSYMNKLNEDGYVVIPNVLSSIKCDKYIARIWDWLEGLESGIDRYNPSTWKDDNWPLNIDGIIKHLRVGHSQFIWDIRCEEAIIKVFETIWNTKELLTSFDGMCIKRPAEITNIWKDDEWVHTDQSSDKLGRHCIQGLITLEEMTSKDATFYVYPKTHNLHQQFFKDQYKRSFGDWYQFTPNELEHIESKGYKPRRVHAPKGSLVLWDSRTFHCNVCALKSSLEEGSSLKDQKFRYVIYVCMTPKKLISKEDLIIKQQAFRDLKMTNHWPHQVTVMDDVTQRTAYDPRNPYNTMKPFKVQTELPVLTDRGKQIAGLL
jgi:hypothetical protein